MKNSSIKHKLIQNAIKDDKWIEEVKNRQANEDWLKISFSIAVKILRHLRANNISQKSVAEKMNCSPQYLNKLLKGNENLTLETICKLQRVLNISLIQVPNTVQHKMNSRYTSITKRNALNVEKTAKAIIKKKETYLPKSKVILYIRKHKFIAA